MPMTNEEIESALISTAGSRVAPLLKGEKPYPKDSWLPKLSPRQRESCMGKTRPFMLWRSIGSGYSGYGMRHGPKISV